MTVTKCKGPPTSQQRTATHGAAQGLVLSKPCHKVRSAPRSREHVSVDLTENSQNPNYVCPVPDTGEHPLQKQLFAKLKMMIDQDILGVPMSTIPTSTSPQ